MTMKILRNGSTASRKGPAETFMNAISALVGWIVRTGSRPPAAPRK